MNNSGKISLSLIAVFILTLCPLTQAEFRTWKGRDGNEINAEYVKSFGNIVVIRDKKGSSRKIDIKKLCDEDHFYIQLQNPPKLELKCENKKTLKKDLDQLHQLHQLYRQEEVRVSDGLIITYKSVWTISGTLFKKSSFPYNNELKLHLYLCSRNTLSPEEKETHDASSAIFLHSHLIEVIKLEDSMKNIQFNFDPVVTKQKIHYNTKGTSRTYTRSKDHPGSEKFSSFICVVTDLRGEILAMEYDNPKVKKYIDKIISHKVGDLLYTD